MIGVLELSDNIVRFYKIAYFVTKVNTKFLSVVDVSNLWVHQEKDMWIYDCKR